MYYTILHELTPIYPMEHCHDWPATKTKVVCVLFDLKRG